MTEVLHLKNREERRIQSGHLWAFSNEIAWDRSPRPEPGEWRRILSHRGDSLGHADVHPGTLIAARIQRLLPEARPSVSWWQEFFAARKAERTLWTGRSTHFRLVNSDGDMVPGLTVDDYGTHVVVSAQTFAMDARLAEMVPALQALGYQGVLLLNDTWARELEGLPREDSWVGEPADLNWVPVHEKAHAAALIGRQKTGFFLDQDQNRRQLSLLGKGKSILDVCSYTGGWGLAFGAEGASSVSFCDRDATALDLCRQGWERSGLPGEPEQLLGDAFDVMQSLALEGRKFDVVVLDPPAFAKSRKSVDQAILGYQRLNKLGLSLVNPGGLLITCSCTGLVDRLDFRQAVLKGSRQARRSLRLLRESAAGPDHPSHPSMLETEYLKTLVFAVN